MVYKIICDDNIIHFPSAASDNLVLGDVKLNIGDNDCGVLSFTMYPNHIYFGRINIFKSKIKIYQNNKLIWTGRPSNISQNFDKSISYSCEGILSFLNDVYYPKKNNVLEVKSLDGWIQAILSEYNSKKPQDLQMVFGDYGTWDYFSSESLTMDYHGYINCFDLLSTVINYFGVSVYVTYDENENALVNIFYNSVPNSELTPVAQCRFGNNMLDANFEYNIDDFATVLIPLGEPQIPAGSETGERDENLLLDISSVNNNSIYIYDQTIVDLYGWIEHCEAWDNVDSPYTLKEIGTIYYAQMLTHNLTIQANMIDLSYAGTTTEALKLYDPILIYSLPHGINVIDRIWSMNLNISDPSQDTYQLTNTSTLSFVDMVS